MSSAPAPPSRRFAGLEGLRGLAAFAVLLTHVYLGGAPEGLRYDVGALDAVLRAIGTAGVSLFFTLSAFLLYRPFAAALLERRPRPSVRDYLRNRFLRVAPAYWLAVLGAGLVLRGTNLPAVQAEGRSLAEEPVTLLANLFLVQGYSPSWLGTGIGPAWSLCVEVAFYAVLPGMAAGAALVAVRTAAGRRRPVLAALLPAGFCLVLGQVGTKLAYAMPDAYGEGWSGSWFAVVLRSFVGQASLFAGGLALAVLHAWLRGRPVPVPGWARLLVTGAWVGLAVAMMQGLGHRRLNENEATLGLMVASVLLLALVVLPAAGTQRRRSVLESRPLAWAGLVSYGVFLWHDPFVVWLRLQGWTRPGLGGFAVALLLTAAGATAIAAASWFAVERPALSLKRSTSTRAPVVPPAALPEQPGPVEPVPELPPATAGDPGTGR